jgi:hypothetical protein
MRGICAIAQAQTRDRDLSSPMWACARANTHPRHELPVVAQFEFLQWWKAVIRTISLNDAVAPTVDLAKAPVICDPCHSVRTSIFGNYLS